MEKINRHAFLNQEQGLMKLGKTEREVLDKLINAIKIADNKNLLKDGLTNQIRTIINGLQVEIRIHILNGDPKSLNAFVGYPDRNLGNIITV